MNDPLAHFKQWFAGFSDACGEGLSRDQWDTLRVRISDLPDSMTAVNPMVPRRPLDSDIPKALGPLNPVGPEKLSAK